MAGNPAQAAGGGIRSGAQLIAKQSGGRKTALALVLGIAAAELVLTGKMQATWHALWGPSVPLKGKSAPAAPASNGGGSAGTFSASTDGSGGVTAL